jgi:recombination protein RecT
MEFRNDATKMESQFALILPRDITADRFVRVLMNAVKREPRLEKECDRTSLLNACMMAAEDGLLPDGREGAIVPFRDNKRGMTLAQWIPMIAGIRKKIRNSGLVKDFRAEVVYRDDEFDYQLGDEPFIHHKPVPAPRSTDVKFVYSIATFTDGTKSREVMPIAQVLQVARKSRAFESGPWSDPIFFQEMCRKTVAKLHAKQLPSDRDLDRVMRRDDSLYDLDEPAARPTERPTIAGGTRGLLDHFAGSGAPDKPETPAIEQGSPQVSSEASGPPDSGQPAETPHEPPGEAGEAAAELPPEWEAGRKIETPDDYAAYFRGWLARESNAEAAKVRFKKEQDIRLDFDNPKFPPELLAQLKAELADRFKEAGK